jgi:hypothetical protein
MNKYNYSFVSQVAPLVSNPTILSIQKKWERKSKYVVKSVESVEC